MEEHGGARRSMDEHGGARRSTEEHGGARRSMEEHGGARRSMAAPAPQCREEARERWHGVLFTLQLRPERAP
ncbi:uncharacterized protein V6R79_003903 [Siganus canaliculatus]